MFIIKSSFRRTFCQSLFDFCTFLLTVYLSEEMALLSHGRFVKHLWWLCIVLWSWHVSSLRSVFVTTVKEDCRQNGHRQDNEEKHDSQPEGTISTLFALHANSVLKRVIFHVFIRLYHVFSTNTPIATFAPANSIVALTTISQLCTAVELTLWVLEVWNERLDIFVAGENLRGGISDLNSRLQALYLECRIAFKLRLAYIELRLLFL